MTEDDDGSLRGLDAREGDEVVDVALEGDWSRPARTLVAAPVVGDHVETLDASRESRKGSTAVESSVDTDQRGDRIINSTFGDGEPDHGGVDGAQSAGRVRRGHVGNLLAKAGMRANPNRSRGP